MFSSRTFFPLRLLPKRIDLVLSSSKMNTWFIIKKPGTIVFKVVLPFLPILCVTLRQEIFAVSRLRYEMPLKILFQLNCEMKMSQNVV